MPAFKEFNKALSDLSDFNKRTGDVTAANAQSAVKSSAMVVTWSILIMSLLSGGILAVWIVRDISRALKQSIDQLGQLFILRLKVGVGLVDEVFVW
jgi:hypothetical protein